MSATVSVRFSVGDCTGAPQALLRGGLYDGSIIELCDCGDDRDLIEISVHGMEVVYYKTEILEKGRIVYLADD